MKQAMFDHALKLRAVGFSFTAVLALASCSTTTTTTNTSATSTVAPTQLQTTKADTPSHIAKQAANCGIKPEQLARIQYLNAEVVARGYAAGISTSIYCDGKQLFEEVQGLADAARKRALAKNDLFRIYSMTKPLTSLATMILVDDKKLKLDDPVATILPEFASVSVFASGDSIQTLKTVSPTRPITVRDLLRHTSGIPYMSAGPDMVGKLYALRGIDHGGGAPVMPLDKSMPVSNIQEFTKRIATIPLKTQPGVQFTYGNSTDVLAAVIEKASGQRYRDFMAARIFKPLGMHDTFFEVPTEKISRLTAAYAGKASESGNNNVLRSTSIDSLVRGQIVQVEDPMMSIFSRPRYIDFGGAGLVSTAHDYQRFLQMLLQDGNLDGVRVVSAGTVADMTRNHLDSAALATPSLQAQGLGFGLGFAKFLDPSKAPAGVPKNGYFWGGAASTYFWVDPERRISGVVMTQVFGGDVMPFYLQMLNSLYGVATPALAAGGTVQSK